MLDNKDNTREHQDIQKPLLLFKNLKTDLDKLKSQINNLAKVKLSSKFLKGINLKKGEVPNAKLLEFTGSRLSHSLKNPQVKEVSERLRNHPEDSKSRLELVAMLLEEEKNRSLENTRDAYLLAMLEVEMPMISTQKINMALAVQTAYLMKLQKYLQDELTETESKIKGDGNVDKILHKQQERLQGEVDFVQKCVVLLKKEPIEIDYELNLKKWIADETIPFGDLKNGFDPMLHRLVFLPLAIQNMELIFEILYRLENKNPVVGFHQSKMFDVLAQIELVIASAGNDEETKKNGYDQLSQALKAISGAVKLVGDIPEKAIEKATVHRYGQMCYTIHRTYISHNIPVPNDHLQRMEKAIKILEPIASDPKISKIQGKLLYALDEKK